jgi:hypothetical protein
MIRIKVPEAKLFSSYARYFQRQIKYVFDVKQKERIIQNLTRVCIRKKNALFQQRQQIDDKALGM